MHRFAELLQGVEVEVHVSPGAAVFMIVVFRRVFRKCAGLLSLSRTSKWCLAQRFTYQLIHLRVYRFTMCAKATTCDDGATKAFAPPVLCTGFTMNDLATTCGSSAVKAFAPLGLHTRHDPMPARYNSLIAKV